MFKNYLLIFLISFNLFAISEEQIISAEIPASAYLEKLVEKSERKARMGAKFGSYFWAGWGALFFQAAYFTKDNEFPGPGFGYAVGTGCFALGIASRVRLLSDKPLSKAGKLYEDIKDYKDVIIKEKASYDLLILLANSSRKKKNIRKPTKTLAVELLQEAIIVIPTIEEKALDGFTNQTPLDDVF